MRKTFAVYPTICTYAPACCCATRHFELDCEESQHAIVFFIDASDTQRFPVCKLELNSLILDEKLSRCLVLILGNRIDKAEAASEDQLRTYFDFRYCTSGKVCLILISN